MFKSALLNKIKFLITGNAYNKWAHSQPHSVLFVIII